MFLASLQAATTEPYAQQQLLGIGTLLRSIAEQAYDKYGIDAIVGDPVEILSEYMLRAGIPQERFGQAIQGATEIQISRLTSPRAVASWLVTTLGPAEARTLIDRPAPPPPPVVPPETPPETQESHD